MKRYTGECMKCTFCKRPQSAKVHKVYLLWRRVYLFILVLRLEYWKRLVIKSKRLSQIEGKCMKCMIIHTLETSYSIINILCCCANYFGIWRNILGAKWISIGKFRVYEKGTLCTPIPIGVYP